MDPKNKRSNIKGQLTRLEKYLAGIQNLESATKIQQRLNLIDDQWKEFAPVQEKIEIDADPEDLEAEVTIRHEFEDRFMTLRADLLDAIAARGVIIPNSTDPPSGPEPPVVQAAPAPFTDVRLPKAEIPPFSGDVNDWLSFYDLFAVTVHHNARITSKALKLQYLKMSLRGEALALLRSVQITEKNYDVAWQILLDRYHNDRKLIKSQIARLINQKPLVSESASHLRQLADTSRECIRALEILKVPVDKWDHILVYHISEKLDQDSRRQWEIKIAAEETVPVESLLNFITVRADALSEYAPKPRIPPPQRQPSSSNTKSSYHTQVSSTPTCVACTRAFHPLFKCSTFQNLPILERRSLVKKHQLCFNCFSNSHQVDKCKSKYTCRVCSESHHSMVHLDQARPKVTATTRYDNDESSQTLLATAVVRIQNIRGGSEACRVLLDSGSQVNLVTEDFVKKLGLKKKKVDQPLSVVGMNKVNMPSVVCCEIASTVDPSFKRSVKAYILPRVTGMLPPSPIDISSWNHLENLPLADPDFHMPQEVDLLLGAAVFADSLLPGTIDGPPNTPRAHPTAFGYIVIGEFSEHTPSLTSLTAINPPPDQPEPSDSCLPHLLSRFWELEEVPAAPLLTPEHQACQQHFFSSYKRDSLGRFVVSLPFNDNQHKLGESRMSALRRFYQLEKRLSADPILKSDYTNFMHEYLSMKHMELVPPLEVYGSKPSFYLPHHYVLKEDSTTTRLRVVFDGSASTSSGISLNKALLNGPTIQEDIFSILVRFRTHQVAFTADIAKMYRMIMVDPSQRDYQRILWRDSPSLPVSDYRLCTVTYGLTSAPYLCNSIPPTTGP